MFTYPDYQTPARRQRGFNGPPLKVEINAASDQGLMTPVSAASCVSSLQDGWNGPLGIQHTNSPSHHNVPLQGLVNPNVLNIGPTDMMHIGMKADAFEHNGLPTPNSYGSGYFGTGDVLGSDQESSPVMLQQPTMELHDDMGWQTGPRADHFATRLSSSTPSYGLPSFQGLNLESPSNSFSSSYSESQSAMYSSCHGASVNECCVGPLQTLANPMQDCSQFMPQEWHQEGSSPIVDQEYNDYGYGSPAQLPSPVSPGSLQAIKTEPYLGSASPFPLASSSKPRRRSSQASGTKNKTAFKRKPSKSSETHIHHGVTEEGNVVKVLVGKEAVGSYKCEFPGCGGSAGKIFKRSEHYKRHVLTHTGDKPFPCLLVETCDRRFGRHDNANQHHWTHVNRWLHSERAKVSVADARLCSVAELGKDRGRNKAVGPNAARETIYAHCGEKDSEESAKLLDYLQRSAGKGHGVHFDWEAEDVEARLLECYGDQCTLCPPERNTPVRPVARTAAR